MATTTGTLLLPRARTSTGQRSFAVFDPATWNSLPPSLRTPELSLSTFKRRLKTPLFQHPWSIVRHRYDRSASSAIQTQLNSTTLWSYASWSNLPMMTYILLTAERWVNESTRKMKGMKSATTHVIWRRILHYNRRT